MLSWSFNNIFFICSFSLSFWTLARRDITSLYTLVIVSWLLISFKLSKLTVATSFSILLILANISIFLDDLESRFNVGTFDYIESSDKKIPGIKVKKLV